MDKPRPKIKITRKEMKSGQIDASKIPAQKHIVIKLNKPTGKTGADLTFSKGSEKKTYEKKDVRTGDPSYGKESKSKPTPEFVKKAQAAGVDSAEKGGKSYAAGKSTVSKAPDKTGVKIRLHPEYKMVQKVPNTGKETTAGMDDIRQKYGQGPKRRLERVAWLKGRNKRTEAGY